MTNPLCRSPKIYTKKKFQRQHYYWSSFYQKLMKFQAHQVRHPHYFMLMNSSQAPRTDHLFASSRNIICLTIAAATIFQKIFSRCPFSNSPNLRRSSLMVKRIFSSQLKISFARVLRECTICPLYKAEYFARNQSCQFSN